MITLNLLAKENMKNSTQVSQLNERLVTWLNLSATFSTESRSSGGTFLFFPVPMAIFFWISVAVTAQKHSEGKKKKNKRISPSISHRKSS